MTGTAGVAGVSGLEADGTGRLMNLPGTLDSLPRAGNFTFAVCAFPPSPASTHMERTLHRELLDSLPPSHPDALHNRRDLRLTNLVAGNYRWLHRALAEVLRPGEVALELGAGTGELGLELERHGLAVDGLDLWPRPEAWPDARQWHQADIRDFDGFDAYPVVIGNLILHQLSVAELAALGTRLRRHARVLVVSEPCRRRVSQVLYRLVAPLLGANYVSLHDAHVSIAAGFRGEELPRLLGLGPEAWDIRCTTTPLGMYRMVARRHLP